MGEVRVLVIDDDPSLLRALRIGLTALGYGVLTAATGSDGLARAAVGAPDAVVLDLGLPDIDGVEVCRRLRQWSDAPVIVLSADGTERRKIAALDEGADDYMTKPFGVGELAARLRAVLRRHVADGDPAPTNLSAGPLELDLVHRGATMRGVALDLTTKEFDLLAFLTRHAGKVCTHRMILEEVWGRGYGTEAQYLRVYAYRLRRKLGDADGRFLRTDPGVGYQLVADEA